MLDEVRFAVPAGVITAICAYSSYGYVLRLGDGVPDGRQAAVVTLFIVQWWVLVQVARPMNLLRGLIVGGSIVGFLVVLYIPWISSLFDLTWHPDRAGIVALGFGILGAAAVSIADEAMTSDTARRRAANRMRRTGRRINRSSGATVK